MNSVNNKRNDNKNMWNACEIKLNGLNVSPTSSILNATVTSMCITCLSEQLKLGLSISHVSNSFNMMIQTNNNFISA